MNTAKVAPIFSQEYQMLNEWYHATRLPYGYRDISLFNRLYKQAYPRLSREERRRVEEWIDKMIDNVDPPKLAKRIFGVV